MQRESKMSTIAHTILATIRGYTFFEKAHAQLLAFPEYAEAFEQVQCRQREFEIYETHKHFREYRMVVDTDLYMQRPEFLKSLYYSQQGQIDSEGGFSQDDAEAFGYWVPPEMVALTEARRKLTKTAHVILQELARDPSAHLYAATQGYADHTVAALAGCPIIIADNVADYVSHEGGVSRQFWGSHFRDLPPTPAPFENGFVEWDARNFEGGLAQRLGCIFFCRHATEDQRKTFDAAKEVIGIPWLMTASGEVQPVGTDFKLVLGADYRVVDYTVCDVGTDLASPLGDGHITSESLNNRIAEVVFMTFALMACKNVKSVDATETFGPPKELNRSPRLPALRYSTIIIDPTLGKMSRPSGGAVATEPVQALHICRGHFREYDKSGPGLFGRGRYGTFWVPAHTRGSAELGQVIPSYEVRGAKP